MPLFHKIIRNHNGAGELAGRYALTVKTAFLNETSRYSAQPEQEDAAPEMQVEEILAQAERKAAAILDDAGKQASAMAEETRRQALAEAEQIKSTAAGEGYEQGYRTALEKAQNEARKIRDEARRVLAQAEETRREMLEGLKEEILTLAVEIAEKVLARELEEHPESLLNVAEEALQLASNREFIALWVNPAELELCRANRERLAAQLPPRAELQIMSDDTIEPGGCVVENEYGKIDAKISTRWQTLLNTLQEGAK